MLKPKRPHIFVEDIELKWCNYHQQYHPLEEFNKNSVNKDGLQNYCLKAMVEKNLAWRKKNRVHIRKYHKHYQSIYLANKKLNGGSV